MKARITRIWIVWASVMALLVAGTVVLMMFPMPGGSSEIPTLGEFFGYFREIGAFETIKILAVVFGPPIVMSYIEIRKVKRQRGF